jgi:hypothetical protein
MATTIVWQRREFVFGRPTRLGLLYPEDWRDGGAAMSEARVQKVMDAFHRHDAAWA